MTENDRIDWEDAGRATQGAAQRFLKRLQEARETAPAANDPAGPAEDTEAA